MDIVLSSLILCMTSGVKIRQFMQTLKHSAPFCELEQNFNFWENSSISQVFQYRKNPYCSAVQ